MFCTNCGRELSPYDRVCPSCGAPVGADDHQETASQQPACLQPNCEQQPACEQPRPYTYSNPVYPAQTAANAQSVTPTSVLVWGIAALACACIYVVSFLGIIFGAIAVNRSNNYIAAYGPISKKVRIGRILGRVGFILGIVVTSIVVLLGLYYIIFR